MLLFAKPTEDSARQIESRLEDLLAADAALADRPGESKVPAPLQHAVDVLLELVSDVEQATQHRAGAVALYYSNQDVACACVGGGEPDVWSHDQVFDAPWVVIREAAPGVVGDMPRARAFSIFASPELEMRIQWPYLLGTPRPEGVVVDARWKMPQGFDVTVREFRESDMAHDVDEHVDEAVAASPSADAGDRGAFFDGWFDDLSPTAGTGAPVLPQPAIPTETAAEVRQAAPRLSLGFEDIVQELRAQSEGYDPEADDVAPSVPPLALVSPPVAPAPPPPVTHAAPVAHVDPVAHAELVTHMEPAAHVEPIAPHAGHAEAHVEAEAFDDAPVEGSLALAPQAAVETAPLAEEVQWVEPASAADAEARTVKRPSWPAFARPQTASEWRRYAWWGAIIVALFALGLWLGTRPSTKPRPGHAGLPLQMMRAVGLASAKFVLEVRSTPPGAQVSIDGKPTPNRTPAVIELPPGDHEVGLTLSDLGTVTQPVTGVKNKTLSLDVPLTGSLQISAPNPATPITVTIDGESKGYAPVQMSAISPGTHELTFSSPGQPPWTQTVSVPVKGDVRIVARPFDLPASGVIHVLATFTDDEGSNALRGANVVVDGVHRGATPLTLELPRGPHSVRAEYRGELVPIQVIDLPGGNERFATFSFGTGVAFPSLILRSPTGAIPRDVPTPVTVQLQGLYSRDVREMWLHVRAADGSWRRYPMTLTSGFEPTGTVVFPAALVDAHGEAPFYVSVLVTTGEEYFTDIAGSGTKPVVRTPRESSSSSLEPPSRQRVKSAAARASVPATSISKPVLPGSPPAEATIHPSLPTSEPSTPPSDASAGDTSPVAPPSTP